MAITTSKYFDSTSYRPLPPYLTIKDSGIHGLGLFAIDSIPAGTYAGQTHFRFDGKDDWLRTPLGGFINHSENANAKINLIAENIRGLTIKQPIKKGEEITVFYTLY